MNPKKAGQFDVAIANAPVYLNHTQLSLENASDYDVNKDLILKSYGLASEACRQKLFEREESNSSRFC